MIKKTILATIILLLLHITYRDLVRPDILISQAEWQNTHIAVETFLYSEEEYENIIVGSSIARRINTDSLSGFFNLAFEGNAAYAGMDLIFRKNKLPKRIFIEVNLLYKTLDPTIDRNNSLMAPFKKHIPALRDGRQPLPLLSAYLESKVIGRIIPYQFDAFSSYDPTNNILDSTRLEVMKKVLIQQEEPLSSGNHPLENNRSEIVIDRLLPYIEKCRKSGIEVLFFQVPSEGTYNVSLEILQAIKDSLNYQNIHYLAYPSDDTIYRTTDNWHLDYESAQLYTSFFKQEYLSMDKILENAF